MRIRHRGTLQAFDLPSLLLLVQPLRDEWAGLTFEATGSALNPVTGAPDPDLALVHGRHRAPGAVYRVRLEQPAAGPDGPTRRGHRELTLLRDDPRGLGFETTDEHTRTTVTVEWERVPSVRVEGEVALRAALSSGRGTGWLARRFGETATFALDLEPAGLLGDRGTLLTGQGAGHPFRGEVRADAERQPGGWAVDVELRVRGRGLGRLALWVGGGKLTEAVEKELAKGLDEDATGVGEELARTAREAEAVGHREYVRRELWGGGRRPGR